MDKIVDFTETTKKKDVPKSLYIISMALSKGQPGYEEDIKTWATGSTYSRNKAISIAKDKQKEIDAGKWDERKEPDCKLRMCVGEYNPKTLDLLSIIELN
jgi:hypothetical protein